MQFLKEAEKYILQCRLITLDEDKHEGRDSLETVIAQSEKEAQLYLAQGRTVILKGAPMSMVTLQTDNVKPEMINQSLRLSLGDIEKVNDVMRLIQRYIDNDSLDNMIQLLQKDAEKSFDDFKEAIRPHLNVDDTQHLIARKLNEIEAKKNEYPLVTAEQAAALFGEVDTSNPSRLVAKLKKELKIIGFYFGNSHNIQIPAFQFDLARLGVHKPVSKLCHILDGLNDWGVYKWLTTHNADLECTPAQAISRPELEEDLLYLAGMFKSDSTLRDSNFVSQGNGNR